MIDQVAFCEPVANETPPAQSNVPILKAVQKRASGFNKVKDSRGRRVEGLWERNGRFYCQHSVPGKGCRRVPLLNEFNQPVENVMQAVEAIHDLRKMKRRGELPTPGRAPQFNDYAERYLTNIETTGKKNPKTVKLEKCVLKGWKKFLGSVRLKQITKLHINGYVMKRKQDGVGNRTANLDVLVLSNCLKYARDEGWFSDKLPTDGYKRLKYVAPKRPLFTKEQFEHLCRVATQTNADGTPKYRNGELLADLIGFMRTTGARVTSALSTLWSDVDWDRRQVHLRNTKYDKQNVVVDFNPELEAVLKEMNKKRVPESEFLFPGTRTKGSVGSLRGTFEKVREEAGLPGLRFHDARHHFISQCVMSGVDFVTIAKWVGHADCSLIAKVYTHISNEHAQRSAKKVTFSSSGSVEKAAEVSQGADLTVEQLLKLLQQKMPKT